MTEPSDAAKKLACELANEFWPNLFEVSIDFGFSNSGKPENACLYALALYIDKVDKVARQADNNLRGMGMRDSNEMLARLRSLMLPDEPDVLREALAAAIENSRSGEKLYEVLRAELAKRGGKILWEEK